MHLGQRDLLASTLSNGETLSLFDEPAGLLDQRAFNSAAVQVAETNGLFRSAWLFLGPDDWVANPGDWIATRMGPTAVVLWRGQDGVLRGFLNRCPFSSQPFGPQGRGSAGSLNCPCHGWAFRSDGAETSGAPAAAQVPRLISYKGLVFGSLAIDGPTLEDQLGDFAWYLDLVLDRLAGGIEIIGGDALRSVLAADWKLGAATFCGDGYREFTAHAATNAAIGRVPPESSAGFQVAVGGGTISVIQLETDEGSALQDICASIDAIRGRLGDPRAGLRPVMGLVFPNMSFDAASHSIQVWNPVGPGRTELYTYCYVDRAAEPAVKDTARRWMQFENGPAGLRTQDLEPPWRAITAGAKAGRGVALNLQMGLNEKQQRNLPGQIGDLYSELGQRAFYQWWQRQIRDAPKKPPADLMRMRRANEGRHA